MDTKRTSPAPKGRMGAIKRAVALLKSENTLRDPHTGELCIDSIDAECGLSCTLEEVNAALGIAPAPAAPNASGKNIQTPAAPKVPLQNHSDAVSAAPAPAAEMPATPRPVSPAAIKPQRDSLGPYGSSESPLSPAAAHAALVKAENDLHNKQSIVETLTRQLRERRSAAAAAIQAWQLSSGRVVTQEQQARAYIASENSRRRAGIKDRGREIVLGPGSCLIDHLAAAQAGAGYNARGANANSWRRGGVATRGLKAR
jgi:hypothetical protein